MDKITGLIELLGEENNKKIKDKVTQFIIDAIEDDRIMMDAYFSCHGGITYSGGGKESTYPIQSDLWWFGFDCAHYNDGKDLDLAIKTFPEYAESITKTKAFEEQYPTYGEIRSTEYVTENCKELADQLAQFSCIVK